MLFLAMISAGIPTQGHLPLSLFQGQLRPRKYTYFIISFRGVSSLSPTPILSWTVIDIVFLSWGYLARLAWCIWNA